MKIKKLLSGVLAGIMVLGTVSFSALAEDTDVYEIGEGKTYTTVADAIDKAVDSDNDGVITYKIYGKAELGKSGYVSPVKVDGETNVNVTTVNFVGADENAEIIVNAENVGTAIGPGSGIAIGLTAINYTNLKCTRENGSWVGDMGHGNNYFYSTLRNHGEEGVVTYTNCVFPNGTCNNFYGTTTYTDCEFANGNGEYALWIYGGKTTVTGESNTFTGKKGVKLYSEDKDECLETTIENATFEITGKPAIVASTTCNLTVNNADTSNCPYGTVAAEPNNHGTQSENLFPEIKIDGETPKYTAKVGEMLCENEEFAKAEAGTRYL